MRRWVWTITVVVVIGLLYWAWPLVGAAEIAAAARRGDTADVIGRVDLPGLRRSLARQIAAAYLNATGKGQKLTGIGRSMAGAAATTVADPYVADLLTPENITALIARGRIGSMKVGGREITPPADLPGFSGLMQSNWFGIVTGSYFDGLRSFVVPVETDGGDRYNVHLKLGDLTWRLAGLDLPPAVVDTLARAILKNEQPPPADGTPGGPPAAGAPPAAGGEAPSP